MMYVTCSHIVNKDENRKEKKKRGMPYGRKEINTEEIL